jgi:hypothetical protein
MCIAFTSTPIPALSIGDNILGKLFSEADHTNVVIIPLKDIDYGARIYPRDSRRLALVSPWRPNFTFRWLRFSPDKNLEKDNKHCS